MATLTKLGCDVAEPQQVLVCGGFLRCDADAHRDKPPTDRVQDDDEEGSGDEDDEAAAADKVPSPSVTGAFVRLVRRGDEVDRGAAMTASQWRVVVAWAACWSHSEAATALARRARLSPLERPIFLLYFFEPGHRGGVPAAGADAGSVAEGRGWVLFRYARIITGFGRHVNLNAIPTPVTAGGSASSTGCGGCGPSIGLDFFSDIVDIATRDIGAVLKSSMNASCGLAVDASSSSASPRELQLMVHVDSAAFGCGLTKPTLLAESLASRLAVSENVASARSLADEEPSFSDMLRHRILPWLVGPAATAVDPPASRYFHLASDVSRPGLLSGEPAAMPGNAGMREAVARRLDAAARRPWPSLAHRTWGTVRLPPHVLCVAGCCCPPSAFPSFLVIGSLPVAFDARLASAAQSIGEAPKDAAPLADRLRRGLSIDSVRFHHDVGDTHFLYKSLAGGSGSSLFEAYAGRLHPEGELVVEFLHATAGINLTDLTGWGGSVPEGTLPIVAAYYQTPRPVTDKNDNANGLEDLPSSGMLRRGKPNSMCRGSLDDEYDRRPASLDELAFLERQLVVIADTWQAAIDRDQAASPSWASLFQTTVLAPLVPFMRSCAWCTRRRDTNQRCSGCRAAHYCCREHQLLHWRQGGHSRECKQLREDATEFTERFQLVATADANACRSHLDVHTLTAHLLPDARASDAALVARETRRIVNLARARGTNAEVIPLEIHVVLLGSGGWWWSPGDDSATAAPKTADEELETLMSMTSQLIAEDGSGAGAVLRLVWSNEAISSEMHNAVWVRRLPDAAAQLQTLLHAGWSRVPPSGIPGDAWREGASVFRDPGATTSETQRHRAWQGKYHAFVASTSADPETRFGTDDANAKRHATSVAGCVVLGVRDAGVGFFDAFTRPLLAAVARDDAHVAIACPSRRSSRATMNTLLEVARLSSPGSQAIQCDVETPPVAECGPLRLPKGIDRSAATTAAAPATISGDEATQQPSVRNAYVVHVRRGPVAQ